MTWLLVVLPFLVVGIAVLFVAFTGGMGAAREAYLTRGGKVFTVTIVILYVGLGLAVPAVVIANRQEAAGAVGALRTEDLESKTSSASPSSSRPARAATTSTPFRRRVLPVPTSTSSAASTSSASSTPSTTAAPARTGCR